MTPSTHPKEKAKELYDKYLVLVQGGNLNETYHKKAKDAALLAVEMALSEWDHFTFRNIARTDYWNLVRLNIIEL